MMKNENTPNAGAFLPDGFEKALVRLGTPHVTREVLEQRLVDEGGKLDATQGAFVPSAENLRRYGFPLPAALRALLELGDRYLIEDLSDRMASFRYLRVAPGGWELPLEKAGELLFVTMLQRFEWNTFSNMQLWEHFSGTMTLGWDGEDNRYLVATVHPDAPVFWMDHETAELSPGAIASSLERFLRVQVGEVSDVPERERKLVEKPSRWARDGDGLEYLESDGPLTRWPPFLAARAEWLVGCLAFGSPEHLERPEVRAFDAERELPLAATNEPLALYWTLRSFLLGERDHFDAVASAARQVSSLTRGLVDACEQRWAGGPAESLLVKARARMKEHAQLLRSASWSKGMSASSLV